MIRLLLVGAVIASAGCSPKYLERGPCIQNSDCELCRPCACARVYAEQDVGAQTSCATIESSFECPGSPPSDCESDGVYQGLCVSGSCEVVAE